MSQAADPSAASSSAPEAKDEGATALPTPAPSGYEGHMSSLVSSGAPPQAMQYPWTGLNNWQANRRQSGYDSHVRSTSQSHVNGKDEDASTEAAHSLASLHQSVMPSQQSENERKLQDFRARLQSKKDEQQKQHPPPPSSKPRGRPKGSGSQNKGKRTKKELSTPQEDEEALQHSSGSASPDQASPPKRSVNSEEKSRRETEVEAVYQPPTSGTQEKLRRQSQVDLVYSPLTRQDAPTFPPRQPPPISTSIAPTAAMRPHSAIDPNTGMPWPAPLRRRPSEYSRIAAEARKSSSAAGGQPSPEERGHHQRVVSSTRTTYLGRNEPPVADVLRARLLADPDLLDWLELTEYHDLEFRRGRLSRFRKRKELEKLRLELDHEERLAQQQRAHLKVPHHDRRAPPALVPLVHQDANLKRQYVEPQDGLPPHPLAGKRLRVDCAPKQEPTASFPGSLKLPHAHSAVSSHRSPREEVVPARHVSRSRSPADLRTMRSVSPMHQVQNVYATLEQRPALDHRLAPKETDNNPLRDEVPNHKSPRRSPTKPVPRELPMVPTKTEV